MAFDEWLEKALTRNLQVVPMSTRVASTENRLPQFFHGDPADRVIASTAIVHNLTLLTPDYRIAFHLICKTVRYRWPKAKKSE